MTGMERSSDDADLNVSSLSSHAPNQWYHIVGTYDGINLSIYVNSALENSAYLGSVSAYTGDAPLRIGNIQNSTHIYGPPHDGAFTGIIDDVRIYNRALTDTEISQLYTIPEPATFAFIALGSMLIRKK